MADLPTEIQRRRTFAIISHPDAGKTTLTEKLLLYGGAIREAGSVKARKGGAPRDLRLDGAREEARHLDHQLGAAVRVRGSLHQPARHAGPPGLQAEDTFRTLVAADRRAVMLIDGAKGVEPQTIKLFKVCRDRGHPDRHRGSTRWIGPSRSPLDLMDEVEKVLGNHPSCPATLADRQRRRLPRRPTRCRDKQVFRVRAHRAQRAEGAGADHRPPTTRVLREELGEKAHARLLEDLAMVETCVQPFDMELFRQQKISPMFFCKRAGELRRREHPAALPRDRSRRRDHCRRWTARCCRTRRSSRASSTRSPPTWTRCTATASRSCA